MVHHLAHKARVLEDHAFTGIERHHVGKYTIDCATKLIRNLKARVFVLIQSALPVEAEEYGLSKDGKTNK